MSKRGKGRPPLSKTELKRRARQAQRMVDAELEAMRTLGRRPLRKEAIERAAVQLKVKARTVQRLLALLEDRALARGRTFSVEAFIDDFEAIMNAPVTREFRRALTLRR